MTLVVDSGGGQYAMYDLHSVTGGGLSCPGIIMAGTKFNPSYKTNRVRGVAYQQSFRAGINVFAPKIKVAATIDTKPLILDALRGGSNLPFLKMQGGGPQQGWAHDNAKINSLKIGYSNMEGILEAEFDFMSLLCAAQTGAIAQHALGGDAFVALDSVITVGGSSFGIVGWETEIMNNLHTGTTAGDGKASGHLRDPNYLTEGPEEHKITVTSLMPFSDTAIADFPAQAIGMVNTFTDNAGTPNHIVFTYTGLAHDADFSDQEFVEDGEVKFKNTLIGKPGCLVVT